MAFLSKEDQAAREAAIQKNDAARVTREAREAAEAKSARRAVAKAHTAARKAVVEGLFESLKHNFVKGEEVLGTFKIRLKTERPTLQSWAERGQPIKQDPVFAAMNVYVEDWKEREELRELEVAALQKLANKIDSDYLVSYSFDNEDIIDPKDGPVGSYVTAVVFTLRVK